MIVETDGEQFHGTRQARERDPRRDQRAMLAGWRPVRTTRRQVISRPQELEATLPAPAHGETVATTRGAHGPRPMRPVRAGRLRPRGGSRTRGGADGDDPPGLVLVVREPHRPMLGEARLAGGIPRHDRGRVAILDVARFPRGGPRAASSVARTLRRARRSGSPRTRGPRTTSRVLPLGSPGCSSSWTHLAVGDRLEVAAVAVDRLRPGIDGAAGRDLEDVRREPAVGQARSLAAARASPSKSRSASSAIFVPSGHRVRGGALDHRLVAHRAARRTRAWDELFVQLVLALRWPARSTRTIQRASPCYRFASRASSTRTHLTMSDELPAVDDVLSGRRSRRSPAPSPR